jgi:hypothetical protein
VPGVKSIGLLVNPTNTVVETQIGEAEAAARALRVRLVSAKASTPSEIEKAFAILGGQQIGVDIAKVWLYARVDERDQHGYPATWQDVGRPLTWADLELDPASFPVRRQADQRMVA